MQALLLMFLMSFLSILSPAQAQTTGKWVKGAPFPQPSEELVGVSSGGKFYVLGGLGPGWIPQGLVYEYEPTIDKWTKRKAMALPSHHIAITELDGKLYVFGGFVPPHSGPPAWVPINNAWEYDPTTDRWKALAPMPSKRGSAVAASVNGKIYVIGGAAPHPGSQETSLQPGRPHRSVSTVEEYDPKNDSWSVRSSMPTARNHAAVGAVNSKIYVIGGRLGSAFIFTASNTNVVEEYDPATDQWGLVKARMPTARSGGAWMVYRDRIYVAGGEHQDEHLMAAFRALEAYDPATNSWEDLPKMPMPRHGLAGAVVGDRLYLASGDIQSAGITGMHVVTDAHDIFEFSNRER
ncbi:Alkyl hydroperoxide reductase/ Thiol specific antioxidant/ Mal allergen (fragment) [Nitrospira japonica]|uniref:Alkyl hydroperoxide reductase/ Thiol specific antioxidant/ Mal allergen n=2 Tax=Nitrospira japonica TaxID=1325564 RepID=A0A1W1I8G1_9BACT